MSNLYLGDMFAAADKDQLNAHKITHIVSMIDDSRISRYTTVSKKRKKTKERKKKRKERKLNKNESKCMLDEFWIMIIFILLHFISFSLNFKEFKYLVLDTLDSVDQDLISRFDQTNSFIAEGMKKLQK